MFNYDYEDGDSGFVKVDTQLPPHELPPGVAADALNKRAEDGRAWPRYGILAQSWGKLANLAANLIPVGSHYAGTVQHFGINPGQAYVLLMGSHELSAFDGATQLNVAANLLPNGLYFFVAAGSVLTLNSLGFPLTHGSAVSASLYYYPAPCGFARFIDPEGFDNLVVLTDEWRSGIGEDGGRGRAWRCISGNAPSAIPLNGQDIYGTARLVPCFNGLLLLRQDLERHYFAAAAVDTATDEITLNSVQAWKDGDLVLFFAFPNASITGTNPPNPLTTYYVQNITATKVKLWRDPAFSLAIDFAGGALGSFYLERRAAQPGYYGNGAPPLLMQTDGSGSTVWQIGFLPVPLNVFATAFNGTSLVLSAANHRLIPGDELVYTHTTGATQTFFVLPVNGDALLLYTTLDFALAGGTANAQTPSPAFTAGDYIRKSGAGGLPMPPLREGAYLEVNRLVGVNQNNVLPISDPLDPLHFSPQLDTVNASLGEGDPVNSLVPMSKDRFVIAKDLQLLQFLGISQAATSWQITNLTKEFGWLAPLASIPVGKDAWGLSRKGITSVFQTEHGEIQGLADPVSRPMKKYIDQIDWINARQACAATWNNRVYFAVPLKGQSGPVRNNAVLVYNILNQGWEGIWTGALLQVYAFARSKVFGQERLCWLTYAGEVAYFDPDGWTDNGAAIADSLTTRTYSAGNTRGKVWLVASLIWDTFRPSLSVSALSPGYNESQALAASLTYDKTKWLVYGQPDYNPAAPANFNAPFRQDYSPGIGELGAGPLDIHQNIPESFRMRVNDWGVQLTIANAQGSTRLQSVKVQGMNTVNLASRRA